MPFIKLGLLGLRLLTAFLITVCVSFAQGLPETDIFVGTLSRTGDGYTVDSLKNLTHRPGYDNQPFFLPDGESFLFTEYLTDQSDIFRCYVQNDSIVRITDTKVSEYSPTVMPSGEYFSVIRVEKDSTQRLWKFPLREDGTPSILLERVKPVGYQGWIDSVTVGLFILGDTNTLHIANIRTQKDEKLPGEIGRSIQKIPNRKTVSFVRKDSSNEWWITEYDPAAKTTRRLIRTLPARDLFAWTPDGAVLMGDSSKLYYWKSGSEPSWTLLADCSRWGISEISRIAVSPGGGRIAVVGIPVNQVKSKK